MHSRLANFTFGELLIWCKSKVTRLNICEIYSTCVLDYRHFSKNDVYEGK